MSATGSGSLVTRVSGAADLVARRIVLHEPATLAYERLQFRERLIEEFRPAVLIFLVTGLLQRFDDTVDVMLKPHEPTLHPGDVIRLAASFVDVPPG